MGVAGWHRILDKRKMCAAGSRIFTSTKNVIYSCIALVIIDNILLLSNDDHFTKHHGIIIEQNII